MLLTTLMSLALAGPPSSLSADVSRDWTWMKTTYEELHRTPELSFGEVETAARMAKELKAMGFAVTEQVGRTGVVGMLRNGRGPQLLLRADMDASINNLVEHGRAVLEIAITRRRERARRGGDREEA